MSAFYYLTNTYFEMDFLNDPFIYGVSIQQDSSYNDLLYQQHRNMMLIPFPTEEEVIPEQEFPPVNEFVSKDNHVKIEPSSPESTCSLLSTTTNATTTTRPKAFSCNYCNRSFARKYDVARHKRIHTGSKPYICPCCNKGFSRSDARVRHFRTELICRNGADKLNQSRNKKKKTKSV